MKWNRKFAEKPIYSLHSPLDVAALLLLGTAKCEGVISAEQKKALHDIYETEFRLGRDEAADLLLASSHLLRDEIYLVDHLSRILERSRDRFTTGQIESLLSLMRRVAGLEGHPNEEQLKLIGAVEKYFSATSAQYKTGWN
jgi:hypothetical protein